MPSTIAIEVTGRDLGATKVLDNVTASQRAAKKAADESAKAQKLAAEVMQQSGGVVSEASLRMVKAKDAERKAAQELAKVQAAARKGYLDEANAARTTAAAMETLARAKMQVAAIQAAPPPMPVAPKQVFQGAAEAIEKRELASQIGTHDFLRERMNERMGEFGISESMGGFTAAIAGGTVVLGEIANKMREAVAESLEFGEAMSRAAAKTGLSVETLSVLHYAAKTTGGDFDGMTSAVAKMDKTIGQATEGNKKATAFMKALGLDAQDMAGREDGAEIAFKRFAVTLGATESPIRRVELATALLGKAGAEQIPTLIELGQHMDEFRDGAERAGTLLDGKTAEALRRTKDRLEELSEKARGAGLAFTEGFLPGLDEMLNVVSGPGTDGLQGFKALGEDIVRVFSYAAGKLYDTAAAASALASVVAGGPFTEVGKHMAEMSREFDLKGGKLEYFAIKGKMPQPSAGDRAYQAGLGNAPGGAEDSVLAAIRKRNAGRTGDGFGGVGDLTGGADKANQQRLKAMEAALDEEKLQYGMSVKAEFDYWTERQNAFVQGSEQYDAIVSKRAALAEEGAKRAHSLVEKYRAEELRQSKESKPEDKAGPAMARQEAQAQESRFDTSNELAAIQQRTQMQMAEMAVRQQVGKTLTAEAAAMQVAAIHAHAYEAELARLEAKRAEIAANPLLSNGEADQQRKIDQLTRQIAQMESQAALGKLEDAYAVKNADQSAVKGATDALHEFRMEAMDSARQMHDLTLAIMEGVHKQLLNAVTGEKTDMRGLGHEVATGVADMALKKMEANAMDSMRPLLDKLGLGGLAQKKRDGGTTSTALYVYDIAKAGRPGAPGEPTAMAGGSGDLAKVLGSLGLPGMPEYKNPGGARPWDEAEAKIPGVTDGGGIFADLLKLFHLGGGKKASGDAGDGAGSGDSGGDTTGTLLSGLSGLTGGMFGGGKGDGSSPSNPLYVKNVGGASDGMGGLSSLFGGGGSGDSSGDGSGGGFLSSLGSLFGGGGDSGGDSGGGGGGWMSLLAAALPGFADGVDDFSGGPAIVGERGPELVNLPRGASVVPNHQAFGAGPSYHHHGDVNIDAGHGVDKEELRGMVVTTIDQRMQMHLRGMGAGMADARSRVPSSRRGF